MKKYKDLLGLALVILGAIILIISFLTGLSNYNIVLFIGLFTVIAGIITHVMTLKRKSEY